MRRSLPLLFAGVAACTFDFPDENLSGRYTCTGSGGCIDGYECIDNVCQKKGTSPGDPAAGDPLAGDPLAGDPLAGDPVPGDPVPGDPVAGDPLPGDPVAGDPLPGDPLAGDPLPGDPVPGDPVAGDPVPGDPVAGDVDGPLELTEDLKVVAPTPGNNDRFGIAVALSGTVLVAGAFLDDLPATSCDGCGSAHVYDGTSSWTHVEMVTGEITGSGHQFGRPIAIDGDTFVVGATGETVGAEAAAGAAYVFQWNGSNWAEVKQLTANTPTADVRFGNAVAIDGDFIVVGSRDEDPAGAAYVFERNRDGANQWGLAKHLTPSSANANSSFGNAVGISVDTVVVGEPNGDDGTTYYNCGVVFIFQRNEPSADQWGEVTNFMASTRSGQAKLGTAVAIDGEVVVAGAPNTDTNIGMVYVFERDSGDPAIWNEIDTFRAADTNASDEFGDALAMEGDTVVVGVHYKESDPDLSVGAAYVFSRNGSEWLQTAKLTATDGAAMDFFGIDVAISGQTVAVGAYQDDDTQDNSGSVYLFTLP